MSTQSCFDILSPTSMHRSEIKGTTLCCTDSTGHTQTCSIGALQACSTSTYPSQFKPLTHSPHMHTHSLALTRLQRSESEHSEQDESDSALSVAAADARLQATQLARQSSSPDSLDAQPLTLMQLVHAISAACQRSSSMKQSYDNDLIRSYMMRYDIGLNEWRRFVTLNPHKQYTRNLIATDNRTYVSSSDCTC